MTKLIGNLSLILAVSLLLGAIFTAMSGSILIGSLLVGIPAFFLMVIEIDERNF